MTGLQNSQLNRAISSGAELGIFHLPKGPSGKVKLPPKVKSNVLKEVGCYPFLFYTCIFMGLLIKNNQPAAVKKVAAPKAAEKPVKAAAKAPAKKKAAVAKPAATKKTSTAKVAKKEVRLICYGTRFV